MFHRIKSKYRGGVGAVIGEMRIFRDLLNFMHWVPGYAWEGGSSIYKHLF